MTAANTFSSPRSILHRVPPGEIWLNMCSIDLKHNVKLFMVQRQRRCCHLCFSINATKAFGASGIGERQDKGSTAMFVLFSRAKKKKHQRERERESATWSSPLCNSSQQVSGKCGLVFRNTTVPGVIWKSTIISAIISFANIKHSTFFSDILMFKSM